MVVIRPTEAQRNRLRFWYQKSIHGLLTKDDYEELRTLYDERIRNINMSRRYVEEMRDNARKMMQKNEWLEGFKSHPRIVTLDRMLLSEFVDVIEVFEGKRITIHFKFEDQIRRIRNYLEIKIPEYADRDMDTIN